MTLADRTQRPKIKAGLERHGKPVTYTTAGGTSYPTVISAPAPARQTEREMYEATMMAGIAGYGSKFTPARGDKVLIDDVTWMVMGVDATYTGEEIGFWEVYLRS